MNDDHMPKYLFEAKYTADGMKGVMKEGGSKRRDAAEQAIKSVGGKLESLYYAFGDHDVLGIAEFPGSDERSSIVWNNQFKRNNHNQDYSAHYGRRSRSSSQEDGAVSSSWKIDTTLFKK